MKTSTSDATFSIDEVSAMLSLAVNRVENPVPNFVSESATSLILDRVVVDWEETEQLEMTLAQVGHIYRMLEDEEVALAEMGMGEYAAALECLDRE